MTIWKYEWDPTWPISAHRGPEGAFEVGLMATWSDVEGQAAEYLGTELIQAELSPLGKTWRPAYQPAPPCLVAANGGGKAEARIRLPWDREFIREVEDARAGKRGDLELKLNIKAHYRLVHQVPEMIGEYRGYMATNPLGDQPQYLRIPVSREHWLRLLQSMGLGTFEVFEVDVRHAPSYPPFKDAVRLLKEAEAAFRGGDWDTTVVRCRKASETAFAMSGGPESDATDMKGGLEVLRARLFPTAAKDPRGEVLDKFFRAIADLRHLGAHAKEPRVFVHREDAELALTTTIALFRYIGQRFDRASSGR